MSFSSEVKEELAKEYSKSRHCQIAELAAILCMAGQVDASGENLELHSDNPLLMQKYAMLMHQIFDVNLQKPLQPKDVKRLLATMNWDALQLGVDKASGIILQNTCCKRAFLRGAFLASGSISDPNKSYHFEIVCHSKEQAEQMKELMRGFDTDAKIVSRKGHQVVYLKEGGHIVDMLNVMEAYVSLMKLENVRILKDMRNAVNRKVNCETANISKTVNAAVKQIEDITKIKNTIGFDELPPLLKEMAALRLEYPDAPLKELGGYLDPPVGKSGVNHRLRRLSEIADKI